MKWATRVLTGSRMLQAEEGAALVEYAMLLLLVVLAAFIAMQFLGGAVHDSFSSSGSSLFSH